MCDALHRPLVSPHVQDLSETFLGKLLADLDAWSDNLNKIIWTCSPVDFATSVVDQPFETPTRSGESADITEHLYLPHWTGTNQLCAFENLVKLFCSAALASCLYSSSGTAWTQYLARVSSGRSNLNLLAKVARQPRALEDMARKSQRLSSASSSAPAHKRAASATTLPGDAAKKTKMQKATPTKSQYFESEDEASADEVMRNDEDNELSSAPEDEASDFGSGSASEDEDEDDEESYDDVEKAPKRGKKSASRPSASRTEFVNGSEVWREGVKTGLGPGKEVIIKKPKARAAGKTPYADDTLHPNTLLFLADLKKNNDREWLKSECFECYSIFHSARLRQIYQHQLRGFGKHSAALLDCPDKAAHNQIIKTLYD